MTTQTLERKTQFAPHRRQRPHGGTTTENFRRFGDETSIDALPVEFDIETEIRRLTDPEVDHIDDRDELGERIMQSAVSTERETITVKCRSVSHATDFATPMRSTLLTLSSAFGGISATVSPSLNLHTWSAMDMLVASLEKSGAGELWQPIGERSIAVGNARHVFVSADNPIRDEATSVHPSLLVEVVGAHLIDPDWFDRVVAPRCENDDPTFVYYGQVGFEGSLFEREWHVSQIKGIV